MAFVEAGGAEERTSVGEDAAPSYFNQREARLVGVIASRLLLAGAVPQGPAGIGVITPYSGQVRLWVETEVGRKVQGDVCGRCSARLQGSGMRMPYTGLMRMWVEADVRRKVQGNVCGRCTARLHGSGMSMGYTGPVRLWVEAVVWRLT